jgi:hypothetical protein
MTRRTRTRIRTRRGTRARKRASSEEYNLINIKLYLININQRIHIQKCVRPVWSESGPE